MADIIKAIVGLVAIALVCAFFAFIWYIQAVLGGILAGVALGFFFIFVHISYLAHIHEQVTSYQRSIFSILVLGIVVYISIMLDTALFFIYPTPEMGDIAPHFYSSGAVLFFEKGTSIPIEFVYKSIISKLILSHFFFLGSTGLPGVDSSSPTKEWYLIKQVFIDIYSIVESSSTELSKGALEAFSPDVNDDDGIYLWVSILIAVLTQYCAVLMTYVTLGLLGLIFAFCAAICWFIARHSALILRVAEISWRKLFHETYVCPQQHCYEEDVQGVYICPSCKTKHPNLYPGNGGLLYAECTCGHIIPTSIWSKKRELSHECSFCFTSLDAITSGEKLKVFVYDTTEKEHKIDPFAQVQRIENVRVTTPIKNGHYLPKGEKKAQKHPIASTYHLQSKLYSDYMLNVYFVQHAYLSSIEALTSHIYINNCTSIVVYLTGVDIYRDLESMYRLISTLEYHNELQRGIQFQKTLLVIFPAKTKMTLYHDQEHQALLEHLLQIRFYDFSYLFVGSENAITPIVSKAIEKRVHNKLQFFYFVYSINIKILLYIILSIGLLLPYLILGSFFPFF